MIRMGMTLPHGTGKDIKIAAFTDAGDEKSLISGGALVAGGDDLISGIESGSIPTNFDIAIATPAMMRKMGKIAKVLGPKGLMPNPKSGTVGEDLTSISKNSKVVNLKSKMTNKVISTVFSASSHLVQKSSQKTSKTSSST
jgi:large subunit ribosomal protein L1